MPSIEWLKKHAKQLLSELRKTHPDAQLSDAQLQVARENGFPSWRALKAHFDTLTVDGRLVEAARTGDVDALREVLAQYPEKVQARSGQYASTLLHVAAQQAQLAVVNELIERGADVNAREEGDNTTPMHWAAATGRLDVVRRLADAGGDVVGHGDDHGFEVIGWATCWDGCDDAAHRAVANFLVSRGAKHHMFSAIALGLEEEVRHLVEANPSALAARLSRNENNQTPLHFAVRKKLPQMVALLLELGADPMAVDGSGMPVAAYATSVESDGPVMAAIHSLAIAEVGSANRGKRSARAGVLDLVASIAVRDWKTAERLVNDDPQLLSAPGVLHLLAKRGDVEGLRWALDRGADPNTVWAHWDSNLTPLHLAILADHTDVARLLLDRGADPRIRDTKHDGDAMGWAEFFQRGAIEKLLQSRPDLASPGS